MTVSISDINKLRQHTGLGLLDCKNALVEADGDFESAVTLLQSRNRISSPNAATNQLHHGRVTVYCQNDHRTAYLLAVACQTHSASKCVEFIQFVDSLLKAAVQNQISNVDELMRLERSGGLSVQQSMNELATRLNEQVSILQFEVRSAPYVDGYVHTGNLKASIACFNMGDQHIRNAAHNVTLHITAMHPLSVDEMSLCEEIKENELKANRARAIGENKPADMVEKIAQARLSRFIKENVLLSQQMAVGTDSPISVGDYLASADANLACREFIICEIG